MVKIKPRSRTISIRQDFLVGNESYSGMRIWCLVRVGSSPTAPTEREHSFWFVCFKRRMTMRYSLKETERNL